MQNNFCFGRDCNVIPLLRLVPLAVYSECSRTGKRDRKIPKAANTTADYSQCHVARARCNQMPPSVAQEIKMQKIFSFDAETNGLWGDAFAVSAAVYQDSKLAASFTAYLGAEGVTNEWVRDNVLPKLEGLTKTHDSYDSMLSAFADFYKANKDGADIIAHMGVPVEAKLLLDMHSKGFIGDWDGPLPFLDVAGVLKTSGYDPTSVDKYIEKHGLLAGRSEAEGLATHHPLYDSIAAALAYMHLMQ